ncbi:MAG: AsmA family protein, partial [Burkholderiales bacterium]
ALSALGAMFGAVLPRTPPFRLDGRVTHGDGRWALTIERARIGGSDLRGDVTFVPAGDDTPARLDGSLESSRMRIADLGRSVGFGEPGRRRGRVLPDVRLDLPSLRDMEATLAIAIARLELGGGTAPVTGLAASLELDGGVLAIGELGATVAGGRLAGSVRVDATATPGRVKAALSLRQVALERWLPPVRGEPPVAARMNAELAIEGRGDSVAQVLGRAEGRARIALGAGRASRLVLELAGLDIAESLAVLVGGDRAIRLDCGLAELAIERGVARPKVLFVDTRDTLLTGQGEVDLGDERIAMRLRAAPRDASPLTLRAPIDVAGTFADPSLSIDRSRVAGTVIASVVLGTLLTPIAALLPLLDFGEGDPPSPCRARYGAGRPSGSEAPSGRSGAPSPPPPAAASQRSSQ